MNQDFDNRSQPTIQSPLTIQNDADSIDKTMQLCSKALSDIFEECAKKYEEAIEAENELHERTIETLKSRAASCRVHGKESQTWLDNRAASARDAIASATASIGALQETSE